MEVMEESEGGSLLCGAPGGHNSGSSGPVVGAPLVCSGTIKKPI